MRKIYMTALSAAIVSLIACNAPGEKERSTGMVSFNGPEYADREAGDLTDSAARQIIDPPSITQGSPNAQVTRTDWDKKIIRTGNLSVSVKDYAAYYNQLREKVKQAGGYVAQEDQQQSEYKIQNSVVIKIPVDQFDQVIAGLLANTEKVNEKRVTSEDVTGEIIDTKSRIEARKQVRERYLALLKEAKTMKDILDVQSEINTVQEDIESASERVAYLAQSASYSTINLTYFQVVNPTAKENGEPSFSDKVGNALKTGWKWFGDFFVGVLTVWPLWILITAAVLLIRRLAKRCRATAPLV